MDSIQHEVNSGQAAARKLRRFDRHNHQDLPSRDCLSEPYASDNRGALLPRSSWPGTPDSHGRL